MRFLFSDIVCILILLPSLLKAENSLERDLWVVPNGGKENFADTFAATRNLSLAWKGWPGPNIIDTSKNKVDLWAVVWPQDTIGMQAWNQSLKTKIDLTKFGSLFWNVDIPEDVLASNARFCLQFKVSGPKYNATSPAISSPGFIVVKDVTLGHSSSSGIPTMTPVFNGSAATAPPSTSPILPTDGSSSSIPSVDPIVATHTSDKGTKAAIGLGVTLGISSVLLLGLFVLTKRRRNQRSGIKDLSQITSKEVQIKVYAELGLTGPSSQPSELSAVPSSPEIAELG